MRSSTLQAKALHTFLNKRQSELRQRLESGDRFDQGIQLLLSQHAMLHSRKMAESEPWSLEDDVLNDMAEHHIRGIPTNQGHSLAWCLWHIARCEDISMNLLVAGTGQVLLREDWLQRMNVSIVHSGNAMSLSEIAAFSREVRTQALRDYRLAVGRRTREIIQGLDPAGLKRKVDPTRLQRVWEEGAVVEAASGVVEYWRKRDVAGLMLMPATRHCLTHLNEALDIKRKLR